MKRKVFCIGFHKTGTTTMRDALTVLGHRVTGPNGVHDPDIGRDLDTIVDRLADKYDAFQDNPWPLVYRKMDARYPGSKFILTQRCPDCWYQSNTKHFGGSETPMRALIYGAGNPEGNREIYKARMQRHDEEALEYFKERPGDLLVLDLTKNGNWPTICGFLDEPIPQCPFPHSNSAEERERTGR